MTDDLVMSNGSFVERAVDLQDAIDASQTRQDAVLLRMNRCGGSHARIDACLSCGVASGTIFEKSSLENFSDAPAVPIQCVISGEELGECSVNQILQYVLAGTNLRG